MNGDQVVDANDFHRWLSVAAAENGFAEPYFLADSNLDGKIDVLVVNAGVADDEGSIEAYATDSL